MRALDQSPDGRDKLSRLLTYILAAGEDHPEQLRDVLKSHIGPEASEVVMSTAERLMEEGRAKGRAEGITQGIAQGQARALLRQLAMKFGPIPDEIQQRVANASTEELDQWIERVLGAAALQDVFA